MKKLKSVMKPASSEKSMTKVVKKLNSAPQTKKFKKEVAKKNPPETVLTKTNPSTIQHRSDKTLLKSTSCDDDDLGMPSLTGDKKPVMSHKTLQKTKLVVRKPIIEEMKWDSEEYHFCFRRHTCKGNE
jgi:hypothetical protein